jgi:hypothetical protein
MTISRLLVASLFATAVATAAPPGATVSDSHKLQTLDRQLVLPAVCGNAVPSKYGFTCTTLRGYPTDGSAFDTGRGKASGEISLDAITYGHFTGVGEREAYVTYSGLEPHSQNFGGGILLRSEGSVWKVVRWFPGGQMDHCVSLPDPGPQRMLCLSSYSGMGETDSSVWVVDVGPDGKLRRANVLKAQDGREGGNADYYCKPAMSSHRPMLLSIDDLKRSREDGVLAVSNISYATVGDVRDACAQNDFADMGEHNATIRYRFVQGTIKIDPPPKFAAVDY